VCRLQMEAKQHKSKELHQIRNTFEVSWEEFIIKISYKLQPSLLLFWINNNNNNKNKYDDCKKFKTNNY